MSEAMEKAYEAIRRHIVGADYQPGTRLKERDLCAELDMSRTPVRGALQRLSAEGLVTMEPRRGAVVADIGPDEVREIYALGAVLESFAAQLAARRIGADDIALLHILLDQMDVVIERDDEQTRPKYMQLDGDFHGAILRIANNRRLSSVMQQIVRVPILIQAFQRYSKDDLRQSRHQHETIVAALAAGDPEWAETAMRSHILAGRAIQRPGDD